MKTLLAVVTVICFSLANAHITSWKNPNQLQPVHSLFVKPSADGITGDLYVAATEEDGVKSQWLTDQPVNFLAASTQPAAVPYATYTVSNDESQNNQKRAIISSPPVQYAYALPVSTDGSLPYPYTVQAAGSDKTATQHCDPKTPYPYSPYQYFYPHMMSAYANAKSVLKESGMSDETANSLLSHASPMWSPSSYAYPYMGYVMMDPSAWTQSQTQTTQTTSDTQNQEKS